MTKRQLYNKIKREAVALANSRIKTHTIINVGWNPFYIRYQTKQDGVVMTMVLRDGERQMVKQRKQKVPPFEEVALEAIKETLRKYPRELVMVELQERIRGIDNVTTDPA